MASKIAKTLTGIGRTGTKIVRGEHADTFAVWLYDTLVYFETQTPGKIILSSGGWATPTTARRMNQALLYRGFAFLGDVRIKDGDLFFNNSPFVNGSLVIEFAPESGVTINGKAI